MGAVPSEHPALESLEQAVASLRTAVERLEDADSQAQSYKDERDTASKTAKNDVAAAMLADEARRRHDEIHGIYEEAYDVFAQLVGLAVRVRMPIVVDRVAGAAVRRPHTTPPNDAATAGGGGGQGV